MKNTRSLTLHQMTLYCGDIWILPNSFPFWKSKLCFLQGQTNLETLLRVLFRKLTKHCVLLHFKRVYPDKEIPKGTFEQIADGMKKNRRSILINCWHQSTYESAAMWRLYSREEDGIAIQTDFNSFKNSFTCSESIYVGNVNYVDYKSFFIDESNNFSRYLHKRKSFEHEHEVRAISARFPNPDSDEVSMQLYYDTIGGAYYEVDLSLLIKEVIVAPFAPDWFLELVKSVTTRYNFTFNVVRSTQADEPTWG